LKIERSVMAAVEYFLKLDGIPGESQDDEHKEEIEVLSWCWSETSTAPAVVVGGGGGAGKLTMQDVGFVIPVSRASPKLFLACASGTHISQAILTCRRADGDRREFLKYTFSDVLVLSFEINGSASDFGITNQISLNFKRIEKEYTRQKEDGTLESVRAGWDLDRNGPI
jgi:type VI secretion system secreted protein Hcp